MASGKVSLYQCVVVLCMGLTKYRNGRNEPKWNKVDHFVSF